MEPAKDLILVHTVQLKPMIKTHSSGRMVCSGISDVVITSVHSEKNPSEVDDDDENDYFIIIIIIIIIIL